MHKKVTVAAVIAVTFVLLAVPFVQAFNFSDQYGAYASAGAASDYYGIYNSDNPSGTGDGSTTATASATAADSAGGSASGSADVDVVTHTITANGAAYCSGSSDCYDTYSGGYSGLGGEGVGEMYDTYTFTCGSCGYVDVSVNYTISGTFGALDNGPVCQGTAEPETLSAVACYSRIDPTVALGNTTLCGGGDLSYGCPPNVIDYQQGWTFCQTGSDYLFYCPSSTSFTVSGTLDLSALMQSESYPYTSAYVASGGNMQIHFGVAADSNLDLPGSESVSATVTFTVTSNTPGATIASAACGCQQTVSSSSSSSSSTTTSSTSTTSTTSSSTTTTSSSTTTASNSATTSTTSATMTTTASTSNTAAPPAPPPLPPTIPSSVTVKFNVPSSTSDNANLVALTGDGILYNVPGLNYANIMFPYVISFCSVPGQNLIRVFGFGSVGPGYNSSEIIVSNWSSILTSSQGWPAEPPCTS